MTDRKLTRDQIAKRALDLCETLRAIDAENEDFADQRATHKAAIEKLENRSTRLRREIETGVAEEEQMHLDDADKGAPEKDPATASYEAGRLARETGKEFESCPYAEGSIGMGAELREAWIAGWDAADQVVAETDDGIDHGTPEPGDDVTTDELEATGDDDGDPDAPAAEPGDEDAPEVDEEYQQYLALVREDGRKAYAAGSTEADCPYLMNDAEALDERKAWIGGWNDAEAEADEVGAGENVAEGPEDEA